MKLNLININGDLVKEIEFELPKNKEAKIYDQALFDQVLAENAGARQGTHSTLTKGEVRGGGKKPLPQKHSGNARQGSTRNPHWVGGGVAFGPKPTRNYKLRINKEVSRKAFESALLLKINNKKAYILEDSKIEKPFTKIAAKLFKSLKINNQKNLVIAPEKDSCNVIKTFANVNKTTAKKVNQVSAKDVMNASNIIVLLSAAKKYGKVGE